MATTAIFGAGVMGETLLSGLLRAGRPAADLVITERNPDRAGQLAEKYGVRALSNPEAAELADTLVLVVKPQDMEALLDEIRDHVREGNTVVSLAAGITTEFLEATLDVWEIPSESARKVGHPAPFPVALPQRLIELYTYRGDLVLDPFMGSGTTAVAAVRSGRHFVGFDTEEEYVDLARARVAGESP